MLGAYISSLIEQVLSKYKCVLPKNTTQWFQRGMYLQPSVSIQTIYHRVTALPNLRIYGASTAKFNKVLYEISRDMKFPIMQMCKL